MQVSRRVAPWLAGLVLAATLAGCAGPKAAADAGDGPTGLAATASTGVIRGVVVDQAIRPVAGANVTARGPDQAMAKATTDGDGFFGFQGLAPGSWFVTAEKVAYTSAQGNTEVVAGVSDPPAVKLQVVFQPAAVPFYTEIKQEAFVQCIVPGANVCAIVNFYPCALAGLCDPTLDDSSYVFVYDSLIQLNRIPDWYQSETVWQSTQAVSPELSLRISAHSPDDGGSIDVRNAGVTGPSPLVYTMNQTTLTDWESGTKEGLSYEIFGANAYTCDPIPTPVGSIGLCGGFVLNQQVSFYIHAFYGYTPPDGWQFSKDGAVPQPPA